MHKLLKRFVPEKKEIHSGPKIRVSSLLYGDGAEPLVLPLIPTALVQAGDRATSIEFAAATLLDRIGLAALVKRHQPRRIFEIGTFRGVTALTMAANAPAQSVLYTLDLPPEMSAAEIANDHYTGNSKSGFHKLAGSNAPRDVGRLLATHKGPGSNQAVVRRLNQVRLHMLRKRDRFVLRRRSLRHQSVGTTRLVERGSAARTSSRTLQKPVT